MARFGDYINRPLDPTGLEGLTESLIKSYQGGFEASRLPAKASLEDALSRATIEDYIQQSNLRREQAKQAGLENAMRMYFLDAAGVSHPFAQSRNDLGGGYAEQPRLGMGSSEQPSLGMGSSYSLGEGLGVDQPGQYKNLVDKMVSGEPVEPVEQAPKNTITKAKIKEWMKNPALAAELKRMKIAPELTTEYNKATGENIIQYKWPDGTVETEVEQIGMGPSQIEFEKGYGKGRAEEYKSSQDKYAASHNLMRNLDAIERTLEEGGVSATKSIGPIRQAWTRYGLAPAERKRILGDLEVRGGDMVMSTVKGLQGATGSATIDKIEKNFKLPTNISGPEYIGRLRGLKAINKEIMLLESYVSEGLRTTNKSMSQLLEEAREIFDLDNIAERNDPKNFMNQDEIIDSESFTKEQPSQPMTRLEALEAEQASRRSGNNGR